MKPSKRTPSKRTRSSVRAETNQPTAAATLTNPSSAKRPRLFRRISSTNLRAVKTTASASPAPGGTVVTSFSSFSSSSPKPLQSRDDNQLSLRPTEDIDNDRVVFKKELQATSDNIESALCIISDMNKKYTKPEIMASLKNLRRWAKSDDRYSFCNEFLDLGGIEKDLAAAEAETQKTKQELNDAKQKYTELDQESKKKLNTMKTSHEGNIQVLMVQNEKLKQDVVTEKAISQQNCGKLVLQVSGLEVQLGFVEHDLSEANTERDNAIKDRRKDNMKLRGQISVAQNTVETLKGDLATMGAEKEGLAKEKEQLRVKLEAKEEDYNTSVASMTASNDKAIASKEETIKNTRAEKEGLAKEKEQLEVKLEAKEEDYNKTVASHENELTAKGEEVAHLQEVVAQLQLEKQKLAVVRKEQQEEANAQSQVQYACQRKKDAKARRLFRKSTSTTIHTLDSDIVVDDDADSDEKLDGPWDHNWDHTGDTYDVVTGDLTIKVLTLGPNNRYPPKSNLPRCKSCGKGRGCRGKKFAECGKVKYECASGCGRLFGNENTFWMHVMGSTQQTGCLPYARKFSNHIAACEVKGNNYQTFRLKKNEKDAQEASVKEWREKEGVE
eukprot:CAMPEP_0170981434 /NCGR_PEP_ID=MMETSP0736-20130129/3021_1 /TAXON_ID=186038 /ORGANISM="Fragilariopsis kerguelensis, Strain L26-C5" /LENGTH=611 /DNA_ID=CAMNT_0011404451 /DNA_START=252 /DNA_END=2087 /DNA_ORIENTATION=+